MPNNTTATEDKLLLLLSYNDLTAAEIEQIKPLLNAIQSWDSFYELARLNKVVPHIYHNLHKEKLWQQIPATAQTKFETRANEIKTVNAARLATAKPILEKFQAQGITFVILKGVLFAETIYHNSYYKRMNDIDILVRKEDIPKILAIFEEEELICIGERIGGNPEKQLKTSHHLPPYIHKNMQCMFGIQWGLKSPLTPYTLDYDAIWSRVQPFSFLGLNAWQMCPEDNFHHICFHLGYYKNGVRDVFDIYNLLRKKRATFDWNLLEKAIQKAGTQSLVYFALSLANQLHPLDEMQTLIEKIKPKAKKYYRDGVNEKTANLHTQLRIGSSYPTEVEKAISEFNATSKFREKLRYFLLTWKLLLFPPMEEAKKLFALLEPNFFQRVWMRLASPARMMKYIASEISWLLLFGLMVKTFYDLIKCGIKSMLGRNKNQKESVKDKLNALGISAEQLELIKKRIQ